MFILPAILILILGFLLHRERTRRRALEGLVERLINLVEEQGTIAFILSRNGGDITSATGETIRHILNCLRGVMQSLSNVFREGSTRTESVISQLMDNMRQSIELVNAECTLAHNIRLALQQNIISINLFQKYDSLHYETLEKAKGHIASAQMFLRIKDYQRANLHTEWIIPNLEYTGRFPRAGHPPPASPEPDIIVPARSANMSETLD